MIDLDVIKSRLRNAYLLDRDDGDALFAAMGDVKALIAEVERLRHDVADLQLQREENIIDNMHAFQEGGHRERAAVLVWLDAREEELNAEGEAAQVEGHRAWAFDRASEAAHIACIIERGEHRREEER